MYQLKSHQKAGSIDEAIRLLQSSPDARLIAGGTDVLIRLREGQTQFEHLVDIHDLPELNMCRINPDEHIEIGSGATFTQLMESDVIRQTVPILATAAETVGGPQVRNVATVGGNICNGVTSADSAPPLFTLNAMLNIKGPDGSRQVPIQEFYRGPGKVALAQSEILVSFSIGPENYRGTFGSYTKYAMRQAMDIATIGCAAMVRLENGKLADLRLAYGVAAPVPIRCQTVEKAVIGNRVNRELLNRIATLVEQDVMPRTSWRASKEFRLQIIRELARRVVQQSIEQAGETIDE